MEDVWRLKCKHVDISFRKIDREANKVKLVDLIAKLEFQGMCPFLVLYHWYSEVKQILTNLVQVK